MVYTYHLFFMYSSVDRPLSHVRVLTGDNSTACKRVSFPVRVLSSYRSRTGISGSFGGSDFLFLWNLHDTCQPHAFPPTAEERRFLSALTVGRPFLDGHS